ncbi:hypothetical protein ACQP2K_11545 [Microbispora siamensis]
MLRSAAVAVSCAAVALSGAVAANATPAKTTPAAQAATNPQGGGEKDKKPIPYPRLDSANVITRFTIDGSVAPTNSTTFTGSARRGHVFVNDGIGWTDLTSVFSPGYLYDVTLAPAPSTFFSRIPGGGLTRLNTSGIPVGLLRVTVRKADGSLFYSDCSVSDTNGNPTLPLTANHCTAPTRL